MVFASCPFALDLHCNVQSQTHMNARSIQTQNFFPLLMQRAPEFVESWSCSVDIGYFYGTFQTDDFWRFCGKDMHAVDFVSIVTSVSVRCCDSCCALPTASCFSFIFLRFLAWTGKVLDCWQRSVSSDVSCYTRNSLL